VPPSSEVPDGAFMDLLNVRFGDGFMEKVQGFRTYANASTEELDNSVMYIG